MFKDADANSTVASMPSPAIMASLPTGLQVLYHLHLSSGGPGILSGSAVLSLDSLCPPFNGSSNTNLFCHHFGVEFHCDGHTYIRAILPYKFMSCFGFTDDLCYRLSHPDHWFALDACIPALTFAWLLDHIHNWLRSIYASNLEIFPPWHYATPAVHIQAFVNGVLGSRLPDRQHWIKAYDSDQELLTICNLVHHPYKSTNAVLHNLNYNYHTASHQGLIVLENDFLIYCKPIAGGMSYTKLILVPEGLCNIIFAAFHANALGSHFNAYHTLHCLWLHYYWPGMYTSIKHMCAACPGCACPIQRGANQANWYTIIRLKPHSWSFTWMPTWLALTLDLRDLNYTLLHVAACAHLVPLSQSMAPMQQCLHPQ